MYYHTRTTQRIIFGLGISLYMIFFISYIMSYLTNGVDISNTLDASSNTNSLISGYQINGVDLYRSYKIRATAGYGLTYKTFGYTFQGADIGTLFYQKIFSSATATYDISNVSNGVVIKVKDSGDLSFNFSLKKLSFAIIGGGGAGGGGFNANSGGGGGAGELIYGTYSSTNNFINKITVTIGSGGTTGTGGTYNGSYSRLISNNTYLDVLANGGGAGGPGKGSGFNGGSGGGSGSWSTTNTNPGSSLKHTGDFNYLGNNGGDGSQDNNDDGCGGGGGGAGAVGGNGNAYANGGPGGNGFAVSFDSKITLPTLGGGGGGGSNNATNISGGSGGGGNGSGNLVPTKGGDNTGGGGGGYRNRGGAYGAAGGSGVLYLYIDNSYIQN